ncbi:uncharacterized protein At2g39795, mitochondrial-like [Tasmannia lanceolata]|uniref:uncharacterized protein At2g39795, mitochondrial-like n=1 Tax=Tasmannia lanceolata TaxID=3420 RepID=UPI00406429C8
MPSIISSLLRKTHRLSFFSSPPSKQIQYCSTEPPQTPSEPSPLFPFDSFDFPTSTQNTKAEYPSLVKEFDRKVEFDEEDESPEGFPFEIIDNLGEQTITLKRDFKGQMIEVEVHNPVLAEEEETKDDDKESLTQLDIPLIVKLANGKGNSVEFYCTACSTHITVDRMRIKRPEIAPDRIYRGPNFSALDEQLQKAFSKYLEVRGIDSSLANFLQDYMIKKDGREFLVWIRDTKGFIEED